MSNELIATVVFNIIVMAVAYGMLKGKVSQNDSSIIDAKKSVKTLKDDTEKNATTLKDDLKELIDKKADKELTRNQMKNALDGVEKIGDRIDVIFSNRGNDNGKG